MFQITRSGTVNQAALHQQCPHRRPWRRWACLVGALFILGGCTMKPSQIKAEGNEQLKVEGVDQPLAAGAILDCSQGETIPFEQLIQKLAQVRVVYVGEMHTRRSHHEIQLRIIRALVENGENVRVGMEMFDHTYAAVLDQWSAGDLDWKNFLKKSHWYANWKFDDSLYRDILAYIQERHLKLIGLNIPFFIPPKISVGGLDSLSAYERSQLPKTIDRSHPEHRAYLEKIFDKHHHLKGRKDFEDFYAAQCAWEDGMAQSVADNLDEATMVVLAGNGHIKGKYGIPDRAFKRAKAPFLTVYLAAPGDDSLKQADADFIWFVPDEKKAPHKSMKPQNP
jgi:uncharacterized iron-regulated protein